MKERPILFNSPMVRAILDGRKTVTRRPVKIQPRSKADIGSYGLGQPFIRNPDVTKPNPECPYGQPGDRLWVREAWARTKVAQAPGLGEMVVYREGDNRTDYGGPWKPSIHMFRRDSRILLEITDVRLERLQDISEEQAQDEGVEYNAALDPAGTCKWRVYGRDHAGTNSPIDSFESLWSSINGAESWNANPWVWCVEFKRVTP